MKRLIKKVIKRAGCLMMAGVTILASEGSAAKAGRTVQAASSAWTKVDGVFVNSSGEEIPGAVLKGIDVSYHNKDIDWEAVKASDIDYAILRCGYGQDYESQDDVKWKEYADACVELGIPFGTYLYSYATTVSAAKSEAEHVLRVIEGYPLTYPVYYDMEDKKQEAVSAKRKAQMAQVFCSTIEAAGYQVGIYANTNWFTTKLTDSYFDSCDKWVAQYNDTCTYDGDYRMWQCTSAGKVDGISTKVDLNFWFDAAPPYQGNAGNPSGTEIQPGTGGSIGTENSGGTENNTGSGSGTESNTGNGSGTGTESNPGNGSSTGTENNIGNGSNTGAENNPGNGSSTGTENNTGNGGSTGTENNPGNGSNTGAENNNGNSTGNANGTETENNAGNAPVEEKPSEITEPKEELKLSQKELTLSYGGTSVLTANKKVSWSSSDKTVASIGSKGKVTPKGVGEAVIIAKTADGETAACSLTVKKRMKDTEIAAIPNQTFTGEQIRPEVTVTDGEKTLVKGTDYKLTYADNMAKGTAVITVKGKGYYTGKTTVSFQIVPKEKLAAPVVSSIHSENGVVTLTWKKNTKASGYEIYRAEGKSGTYTLKKTITKNTKVTYSDKNLKKGTKYYYRIRAYKLTDSGKQYGTYAKVSIKAG